MVAASALILCACTHEYDLYDGDSLYDTPEDVRRGAEIAYASFSRWRGNDACMVFPIVTDIHSTNIKRYKQVGYAARTDELFHYDLFVNLGDIGIDYCKDHDAARDLLVCFAEEMSKWEGAPSIYCKGNHEYLHNDITQDEIVDALQLPLAAAHPDCRWYADHACGYVDFKDKMMRVYFLNSSDFDEQGYMFSVDQLRWLANTLAETPKSFDVLILVHFPCSPSAHIWSGLTAVNQDLYLSILEGFNNRTAGFGVAGVGEKSIWDNPDAGKIVKWDFTGVSPDTHLVGNLCGDSHFDSLSMHRGIWFLTSQGYGPLKDPELLPHGSIHTVFDDTRCTLFDIVAIKYEKRQVGVFRVGAGSGICNRFFSYGSPRSASQDSVVSHPSEHANQIGR